MIRPRRRIPLALRVALPLLSLAAGLALAPPLQAQPTTRATPTVVRSVPPEPRPNPALEAALRQALFPVRIDDGQGHGPDPGSAEGEMVKRNKIKAACEGMPAHRYTWNRVDLTGDGRAEVVAQVVGPMFCGTGGCPLLIFREPSPGRMQLVTQMGLFKDPLIVAERRHNGWKELITRVRVDAGTSYYTVLRHDGRTYPTNPSVAPAIPLRRPEPGTGYLAWNEKDPREHRLPCEGTPQKRGL
jgi:hypothetical protein